MNDIDGICYEINKHDRFIVYGSPTLLNLLFDFQVDMKMFDKTVLLSSVNNGKILVPKIMILLVSLQQQKIIRLL